MEVPGGPPRREGPHDPERDAEDLEGDVDAFLNDNDSITLEAPDGTRMAVGGTGRGGVRYNYETPTSNVQQANNGGQNFNGPVTFNVNGEGNQVLSPHGSIGERVARPPVDNNPAEANPAPVVEAENHQANGDDVNPAEQQPAVDANPAEEPDGPVADQDPAGSENPDQQPPENPPVNIEQLQNNLNVARLDYIRALAARGNILLMRKGFQRGAEMERVERAYSDSLTVFVAASSSDELQRIRDNADNDVELLNAREALTTRLVELQIAEQAAFDTTVQQNVNEDTWRKIRKAYQSKTGRFTRLGLGGAGIAAAAFAPPVAPFTLVARSATGFVGGALAGEALLEKFGPLSHKGEADRLQKQVKGSWWDRFRKFSFRPGSWGWRDRLEQETQQRLDQVRGEIWEMDPDDVLNEVARLRALQVAKASDIINASAGNGDDIAHIINLFIERESEIYAQRVREDMENSPEGALENILLDRLNREVSQQKLRQRSETDKERGDRAVRRILGVGAGAALGIFIGSRGIDALTGEDASSTVIGDKVEPEDVVSIERPTGLGNIPITIDEPGEGIIEAIAERLEMNDIGMDHKAAMAFANKAFQVGELDQATREMFNLAHEGDQFYINLSAISKEELLGLTESEIKALNPNALLQDQDNVFAQLFRQDKFYTTGGYAAGEELGQPGNFINEMPSAGTGNADGSILGGIVSETVSLDAIAPDGSFDFPADLQILENYSAAELSRVFEGLSYQGMSEVLNHLDETSDMYDLALDKWSVKFATLYNETQLEAIKDQAESALRQIFSEPDVSARSYGESLNITIPGESDTKTLYEIFGMEERDWADYLANDLSSTERNEYFEAIRDRFDAIVDIEPVDIDQAADQSPRIQVAAETPGNTTVEDVLGNNTNSAEAAVEANPDVDVSDRPTEMFAPEVPEIDLSAVEAKMQAANSDIAEAFASFDHQNIPQHILDNGEGVRDYIQYLVNISKSGNFDFATEIAEVSSMEQAETLREFYELNENALRAAGVGNNDFYEFGSYLQNNVDRFTVAAEAGDNFAVPVEDTVEVNTSTSEVSNSIPEPRIGVTHRPLQ